MKQYLLSLILITTINCLSQVKPIVVHSKSDKRLIAYKDSLISYLSGYEQLKVAEGIKNVEDTAEGMAAMRKIDKLRARLNPNIKYVELKPEFTFTYMKYHTDIVLFGYLHRITNYVSWNPELYKKPVQEVIYQQPVPIEKTKVDTITKKITYIYIVGGKQVTKEKWYAINHR
jgi:hypothetical protein